MAKLNQKKVKQAAYQKKQAEKGAKVVKWIFGVLLALAAAYAAWSVYIVS